MCMCSCKIILLFCADVFNLHNSNSLRIFLFYFFAQYCFYDLFVLLTVPLLRSPGCPQVFHEWQTPRMSPTPHFHNRAAANILVPGFSWTWELSGVYTLGWGCWLMSLRPWHPHFWQISFQNICTGLHSHNDTSGCSFLPISYCSLTNFGPWKV